MWSGDPRWLCALQPSGYISATSFNVKNYFLHSKCIYVFCVDLRIQCDYFPIQRKNYSITNWLALGFLHKKKATFVDCVRLSVLPSTSLLLLCPCIRLSVCLSVRDILSTTNASLRFEWDCLSDFFQKSTSKCEFEEDQPCGSRTLHMNVK
jgi:hypothetical protein